MNQRACGSGWSLVNWLVVHMDVTMTDNEGISIIRTEVCHISSIRKFSVPECSRLPVFP